MSVAAFDEVVDAVAAEKVTTALFLLADSPEARDLEKQALP